MVDWRIEVGVGKPSVGERSGCAIDNGDQVVASALQNHLMLPLMLFV